MNDATQLEQGQTAQAKPENRGDGKEERDARGRFAAGNKGGPGNPFARRTAAMREAVVNAVTQQDLVDITVAMIQKAKNGDTAAAKLVYSYTVGRTAPPVEPDTLDQKELAVFAGNHVGVEEFARIAQLLPVGAMVAMLRAAMPFLEEGKSIEMKALLEKAGNRLDRKMQRRAEEAEEMRALLEEAQATAASPATPAATPAADPMAPANSAAGQEDLKEVLAAWNRETEELKEKLGMNETGTSEPQPPANLADLVAACLAADQAEEERRRQLKATSRGSGGLRPGPGAPSPIGSNGALHAGGGNGKG